MATHKEPMPRAVSRALKEWLRARGAVARRPLRLAVRLGALAGLLLVPEGIVAQMGTPVGGAPTLS